MRRLHARMYGAVNMLGCSCLSRLQSGADDGHKPSCRIWQLTYASTCGDKPLFIRDLFRAAHQQSLPVLNHTDELRRLKQRIVGAGIEPRIAATELDNMKLPKFEVTPVDVCDFQLATCRRSHRSLCRAQHCRKNKAQ
jgi:hypothetical protein